MTGTVYSFTVVSVPPQGWTSGSPYRLALVDCEDGQRLMARIQGPAVSIGDRVTLKETRDGVAIFEKIL